MTAKLYAGSVEYHAARARNIIVEIKRWYPRGCSPQPFIHVSPKVSQINDSAATLTATTAKTPLFCETAIQNR